MKWQVLVLQNYGTIMLNELKQIEKKNNLSFFFLFYSFYLFWFE